MGLRRKNFRVNLLPFLCQGDIREYSTTDLKKWYYFGYFIWACLLRSRMSKIAYNCIQWRAHEALSIRKGSFGKPNNVECVD